MHKPRSSKPPAAGSDALTVARQALAIARTLRGAEELKYFDTFTLTTDYTAGVVTPLGSIPQGVAESQRVGEKVRLQRIQMNMRLYDNVNSNTAFRVMIYSLPSWASTSVASGVAGVLDSDSTLAFVNEQQRPTFRVHYDELFTDDGNFAGQDRAISLRVNIPLKMDITWTGANATDYEKNTLYLLVTADYTSTAGSGVRPVAGEAATQINTRLWYTDS